MGVYRLYVNSAVARDVTVFNRVQGEAETWIPTVIKGCFWDDSYGSRMARGGADPQDLALAIVPIPTETDGKSFLPFKEFASAPDKTEYFTFRTGDKLIKGISEETFGSASAIERRFSAARTITEVRVKDYGHSPIKHFELVSR
jgi:hypothetical protein